MNISKEQIDSAVELMAFRGLLNMSAPDNVRADVATILESLVKPRQLTDEEKQNLALLELFTGMDENTLCSYGRILDLNPNDGSPIRQVPMMALVGIGTPVVRKLQQAFERMMQHSKERPLILRG